VFGKNANGMIANFWISVSQQLEVLAEPRAVIAFQKSGCRALTNLFVSAVHQVFQGGAAPPDTMFFEQLYPLIEHVTVCAAQLGFYQRNGIGSE
jgi:hypothetical protein